MGSFEASTRGDGGERSAGRVKGVETEGDDGAVDGAEDVEELGVCTSVYREYV